MKSLLDMLDWKCPSRFEFGFGFKSDEEVVASVPGVRAPYFPGDVGEVSEVKPSLVMEFGARGVT